MAAKPSVVRLDKGSYYIGDEQNGLWHGRGVFFIHNGDVFEGEWREGHKHRGTYKWACGDLYQGEWDNDQKHGKGCYWWPDGTYYEGDWVHDAIEGKGIKRYPTGNVYEGDFKSNVREGRGVFTWADGTRYEGEFKEDAKCGEGTATWLEGYRFVGQWQDDKRQGVGMMYFEDGGILEATYDSLNGDRKGKATFKWPNGDFWEGEFLEHKRAEGMKRLANGDRLTGVWCDLELKKSEEEMILTKANGEVLKGRLVNNQFVPYDNKSDNKAELLKG